MKRLAAAIVLLASCTFPKREGAPLSSLVDAVLGPRQNDGYAGVILGSTGDRLWAQGVAPAPGLQGRFQYIHNPSLPGSLFAIEVSEEGRPILFPPLAHQWWPSHIAMEGRGDGLQILERKFITKNDHGCDLVRIVNESRDLRRLTLRVRSPMPDLRGKMSLFGVDFTYALAATGFSPALEKRRVNAAFNPGRGGAVTPRASFTWSSDSVWAPLDGERVAEHRWTCWSSGKESDWYEVEFDAPRDVNRVVLGLFDDGAGVRRPKEIRLEGDAGPIDAKRRGDEFTFETIRTKRLRLVFTHQPKYFSGLVEMEVFPGVEREVPVLERVVDLKPGEGVTFVVEMAFDGEPRVDEDPTALLERHLDEYNDWFAKNIPDFDCSDAWFTKLWYYRWYVVRHCLADPKAGLLKDPCFFEGRHMDWYPRVITYGHALQVEEARWLRDPKYAYGHCRTVFENQLESGLFPNLQADRKIDHYYTEWIATEPWSLHLVHPNPEFLEWARPRMKRNVEGLLSRFDEDGDSLLQVFGHFHTGMEFQPSFFWFNESRSDTSKETAVERVDYTCYFHAILLACGDTDAAAKVRAAVLGKMWDPERKFFYSLHPKTHEKALVEEIVGFYPYAFRVVPENSNDGSIFERLFKSDEFWAPFPAHSASKKAEFFSLDKPGGCHWNGPTWPFANSLIVEALANAIKYYKMPNVTRRRFFDFLQRFTRAQFEDGDFNRPLVGEVYHSETGKWKTPTEDYFHSTYNDLLIRHVGGLTPRADETLEFDPIVEAFPYFRFRNVPYHGGLLDILWDEPDGRDVYNDGVEGFTVRRNGQVLFTHPKLERVVWPKK